MNVHIDLWTWRTFDKYLLTFLKQQNRPWIQQVISKQLTRRPLTKGERFLGGGTKACLNMQSIFCTSIKLAWTCREASARLLQKANRAQGSLHVQGARLAVQRVLCTSSQLAWACKESFARSSFREIQSIDILVPKIWYHVPNP